MIGFTHILVCSSYIPLLIVATSVNSTKSAKMEEKTKPKKKRTVMVAMDGSKHSEYAFKCKYFVSFISVFYAILTK